MPLSHSGQFPDCLLRTSAEACDVIHIEPGDFPVQHAGSLVQQFDRAHRVALRVRVFRVASLS